MIISNRFLDNKNNKNDKNNDKEFKKILLNNSHEILFFGFVDFARDINTNKGTNI